MAQRYSILDPNMLRPVLTARSVVHVLGAAIGLVMVVISGASVLVPLVGMAAAILAWHQRQNSAVRQAWLVDSLYAVALSASTDSPIGLTLIVGWAGALGLVDTPKRWQLPVGVGVAMAAAAVAWEMGRSRTVLESAVAVGAMTLVAVFFGLVFRAVGRLLRQNDEELRAFFDRVPVALSRTTPDGRLLEYNHAIEVMFDKPEIGEQVADRYVDPADRVSFVKELMHGGVVHNHEAQFRTRPGETIDAVIAANAVNDDRGNVRFIETAIFDFTSLRRTEAAREQLAKVIDSTSDLVSLVDWDGSVRYSNAAAREWMRKYITDDDYVHAAQALHPDDFASIRDSVREHGLWGGVVKVPGKDAERMVNTSLQVIEAGGDYTVASISRDVTDEVETERKLKELVRAKDELVASISHEIRTPLSVVLGLAAELRDHYGDFDADSHREFATLIADQGQEMANIVEDLLVAARADTGSIVLVSGWVDLAAEVEMTLRVLPEPEQSGQLSNAADAICWGDENRIRQIIRNVIVNARRYGGRQISVETRHEGELVYLDIIDDGPGVPDDEAAIIFEPFERAHSAATQPASIGLGLSVSRDLARRMGGDLVYSRKDEMTVFTLVLPAQPVEATEIPS